MPWHLVTRKSRTCVVRDGETDPIPGGCHADEDAAKRHLAALYANEPGARLAYSPEQPRDDHGRFGEGSGDSGKGPATFLSRSQSDVNPTTDQAKVAISQRASEKSQQFRDNMSADQYTSLGEVEYLVPELQDAEGNPVDHPETWQQGSNVAMSESSYEWQSSFAESQAIQAAADELIGHDASDISYTGKDAAMAQEMLGALNTGGPDQAYNGLTLQPEDGDPIPVGVQTFNSGDELVRGMRDPEGTIADTFRSSDEVAFSLGSFVIGGPQGADYQDRVSSITGEGLHGVDPTTDEPTHQSSTEVALGYATRTPDEHFAMGTQGTSTDHVTMLRLEGPTTAINVDGGFEAVTGGTFKVTSVEDGALMHGDFTTSTAVLDQYGSAVPATIVTLEQTSLPPQPRTAAVRPLVWLGLRNGSLVPTRTRPAATGGSHTAAVVSSIVVGVADGCSVVTREGVSWEVHELGCDHFASGHRTTEELTDGDGARIARIDTTPMAEVFAAPEYAPAEWYAEADPDVWIAAWREEHGIDPHGDIKRLTITEDGRVGARFYDAGQCILNGGPGACPKPSPTRYAAFHQQDAVLDDGNMIVVGAIGNTGGHASRFARLEDAQAKYNDPRIQMLKGRAYDDEKGGYFVGSVVPAEQRRAAGVEPLTHGTIAFLRSCAMSGTWYPTADYGFSPEWWKAHGITAAQVAAVQGYDSIGPQLVTRPALPLVRAVRYAGVEEDRPIIVGGFGGVPDIEDEASYSAEDDCTDCEEDDVVDQATQERIERLEGLVEAQQSVLDQQSAARAAAIEAELTGVPEVEIPPPDGFDERTIHLPTQDLVWIAAAATKDPTQQERRKMAKSGVAMPDGSFYIRHLGDLADAKSSVGRAPANKRNDVIKHINKRAKALGGKPVGG